VNAGFEAGQRTPKVTDCVVEFASCRFVVHAREAYAMGVNAAFLRRVERWTS